MCGWYKLLRAVQNCKADGVYVFASITNPLPTFISATITDTSTAAPPPSHHHLLCHGGHSILVSTFTRLSESTHPSPQLCLLTTTQSFPEHLFNTHCAHGPPTCTIPVTSVHRLSFTCFLLVAACVFVCVCVFTLAPYK